MKNTFIVTYFTINNCLLRGRSQLSTFMHRLCVPVLLNSIHHTLIVSHLLVHNNKQNYCDYENIHLFIIKLHVALHRSTLIG